VNAARFVGPSDAISFQIGVMKPTPIGNAMNKHCERILWSAKKRPAKLICASGINHNADTACMDSLGDNTNRGLQGLWWQSLLKKARHAAADKAK
jgi:hypothetical protein